MDSDQGEHAVDSAIVNPAEPAPSRPDAAVSTPPEPDPGPERSEDALAAAIAHREQAAVAVDRAAQVEAFRTLSQQTWINEIKADPEFGGEKYLVTDYPADNKMAQGKQQTWCHSPKFTIDCVLANVNRQLEAHSALTQWCSGLP